MKIKLVLILLAALILAGCRASKEEIASDEKALVVYKELNTKRIEMVNTAMESCAIEPGHFEACITDLCRVDTIREASGCQQGIIEAAGKVALELPKHRANAWDTFATEAGQTLRAVIPFVAAYAQTRNVVHAMRDVSSLAVSAAGDLGRPNNNYSVNNSNNRTSGDEISAGRDIVGGDRGGDTSTAAGRDIIAGDRGDNNSGNSGRIYAPGNSCIGPLCQPVNLTNNDPLPPPPPDLAPIPGDADGWCLSFSTVQDPDCGP